MPPFLTRLVHGAGICPLPSPDWSTSARSPQAAFAFGSPIIINQMFTEASAEEMDFVMILIYGTAMTIASLLKSRSQYILENALPSGGGFVGVTQAQVHPPPTPKKPKHPNNTNPNLKP